jgi:lipid-A-disaccharide synthase
MALLPGSRLDEIRRILPIMVTQADHFKAYQLVVAGLSHIPSSCYQKLSPPTIKVVYNQTYDLLAMANVGMIASGAASLEAALFNLLQVVVYKTDPCTYFIYKKIVTIQNISLVNLLVGQTALPELIQDQCTSQRLYTTLTNLLEGNGSAQQKEAHQTIRRLLGKQNAAVEAAKIIVASIKQSFQE